MTQITRKGRELAQQITGELRPDWRIAQTCSLICRHAVSLHRVNEAQCNGHPAMSNPHIDIKRASRLQERFERDLEAKDERLTKRVKELAATIPGCVGVDLSGDPRGLPVKLVMKDRSKHNSWGGEGVAVPL